ncbi:MAG: sulfatase-like hydrolase/transferase [Sedimentisphaeraceae bacterium JB056]
MKNNQTKPNIIVIMADDQGYGDLSIYGNKYLANPNIERLAANGVVMNQHYSGSPLCGPARASFLTGRYNHRTAAISVESNRCLDRISLREKTMADYFRNSGYSTAMVGKWHNGLFDRRFHPNARGFKNFAGFLNGGMGYYDWVLDYNGSPRHSNGQYLTDVFTEEAVDFIGRSKDNPFFLYLAYNAPHSPLEAPRHLVEKYQAMGGLNETVSTIYAMIEQMDTGIGRILDKLDQCGIDQNTIVLFTSDNGPWLGDFGGGDNYMRYNGPFSGMKNFCLEGGIRVPAIISWPAGIQGGRTCDEMIHFTDWLPTLCFTAGCRPPSDAPALDGFDVMDVLRGNREFENRKLFWQHNRNEPVLNCNSAMRDGDWKLVWPYPDGAIVKSEDDNYWYHEMFKREHFEMDVEYQTLSQQIDVAEKPSLYNLKDDPSEKYDLAAAQPQRLKKMQTELENWFNQVEKDRHESIKYTI